MTRSGYVYELPIVGRLTTETDGLHFVPTPTTRDYKDGRKHRVRDGKIQMDTVGRFVQLFPTPRAAQGKSRNHKVYARVGKYEKLGHCNLETKIAILDNSAIGGLLNPMWVEWLMGFPIGFTASKDWVTPKSRSKPQPPTDSLGECDAP
jgi:hypothetical protein